MMKDRHEHSIIDTCVAIHDHITGSGDGLDDEKLDRLKTWLEKRISPQGWQNTQKDFHASAADYDHAVRLLGLATLEMLKTDSRSF